MNLLKPKAKKVHTYLHRWVTPRLLEAGMTQQDLGKAIGIHPPAMSDYINGYKTVGKVHVVAMCYVLGCPEEIENVWANIEDANKHMLRGEKAAKERNYDDLVQVNPDHVQRLLKRMACGFRELSHVDGIEQGEREMLYLCRSGLMPRSLLNKIAEYLGIDVSELTTRG